MGHGVQKTSKCNGGFFRYKPIFERGGRLSIRRDNFFGQLHHFDGGRIAFVPKGSANPRLAGIGTQRGPFEQLISPKFSSFGRWRSNHSAENTLFNPLCRGVSHGYIPVQGVRRVWRGFESPFGKVEAEGTEQSRREKKIQ